ncbi:hypothetical protein ES708_16537 [subsurface metagenome]
MITIDKSLSARKVELLNYFRERANESIEEIKRVYGSTEFKKQASAINKATTGTKDNIIKTLLQKAAKEKWSNKEILQCILMVTYSNYIVMIECRNEVWPYEYMTFSRRIGELWEPFCNLCFEYPIRELALFVPPLFSEVKQKLTAEIEDYIGILTITEEQKKELKSYYNKVWGLVMSGEIKLELDLHFEQNGERFVVDFKSGFGSNEKGNTNRLLLVASIYKNLEENYKCLLLVRAEEDRNNNYFHTLKNSGIWMAYCGNETYAKIKEYSSFDIKQWIENNINWSGDFRIDTMQYFRDNNLDQYLKW